MLKSTLTLSLCLTLVCCSAQFAAAYPPFKKPFEEKYVRGSENAEFKTAFRKAGCNVCHVKDKPRDWLNAWGHALAKEIPGNAKERLAAAKDESRDAYKAENARLLEELTTALKKAESVKTSKDDRTFAERFAAEELPTAEGARSLYAHEEDAKSDDAKTDDEKSDGEADKDNADGR